MKLVGVTGGVACGKSTVVEFLGSYPDVSIVTTDDVSKAILAQPEHRSFLCDLFGDLVPESGDIDHKKIGAVVFSDSSIKKKLEKYVHPLVWDYVLNVARLAKKNQIIVVESAILYEIGWHRRFDCMVAVGCSTAEQHRRLYQVRGMTEEQVVKRLNSQMSSQAKIERADTHVNTDCSTTELKARVKKLHTYLRKIPERSIL